MKVQERSKTIIKTSIIGILLNLLLSVGKAIIGYFTGSIAIMMDSLNNLTDTLSATVTIVGTKLAMKSADEEHPYGHGRIEYLATLVIAGIILYAGVAALVQSVKHIYSGGVPEYNKISLILIGIAIFVKIFLWIYYTKVGKKCNSNTLVNSGTDAGFDVVISSATLVSAFIFIIFNKNYEAYLAAIISLIIIRSGFNMIMEAISTILGERVDKSLAINVKKVVNSFDDVRGCYDLTLNNYGPDKYIGSFHIEVSDKLNAVDIDLLTRKITNKVLRKTGVVVSAIGIYSLNINDKKALDMKKKMEEVILEYEDVLSMHGFYVNHEEKTINADLVMSFKCKNKKSTFDEIKHEFSNLFKDYKIYLVMDDDISD